MRSLNGVWTLGDVADVEHLVRHTLAGSGLNADDTDDCVSYLFEHVWRTYQRWEPERGSFSNLAYRACKSGLTDWRRKRYGRTRWSFSNGRVHERKLPQFVPLDDDSSEHRLGSALAGSGVDGGPDQLADQLRALDARSRAPAGYERELRKKLPRRSEY